MFVQLVSLSLNNWFSSWPATQPGGPVVSLTTYGKRIQTVHLAIESIAAGSLKPSRLILWIDVAAVLENLPPAICRLQERGLEVRLSRNYGPHTKYYPYLESEDEFRGPLVIADDDTLYPRYWLRKLYQASQEHPNEVNCFWAHVVSLSGGTISSYRQWKQCDSTRPSFLHVAMGVCGVIYPPQLLARLKRAGTAFEECCPKGDDLWLHVVAIRNGFKVRQILPRLPYFSFHLIPGTGQTALSYENVTHGNGNDHQILRTYSEADVRLLLAE